MKKNQVIKGKREGYWELYYGRRKLWIKCNYINNYLNGYWEEYHDNGKLYTKGQFINDIGTWLLGNISL